mmetsp:Transcript_12495/g.38138  ORF Transcript_12495/g.38138 Transcript_12495/m.38138 type:complete len:598 (-) Transcript_12495:1714-3507(-)|eukprot:CAMPEP_0198725664 /NCGR_PEP_ID=MMETSP1475-20131203/2925_1 /TAXON_ID= ORGANISM="Unidentified sp., Strain CCMP1999" /NCGR_SAMPLE_ID=MMETSP1475 /ASSEMBLY_ACC=CAM_ASM_001111 /LENGTH=597 /DNA_ID=CAMNT_0044487471 /DNA_START=82 /DNA_END=1875 /DNA_ORIENTATION=-
MEVEGAEDAVAQLAAKVTPSLQEQGAQTTHERHGSALSADWLVDVERAVSLEKDQLDVEALKLLPQLVDKIQDLAVRYIQADRYAHALRLLSTCNSMQRCITLSRESDRKRPGKQSKNRSADESNIRRENKSNVIASVAYIGLGQPEDAFRALGATLDYPGAFSDKVFWLQQYLTAVLQFWRCRYAEARDILATIMRRAPNYRTAEVTAMAARVEFLVESETDMEPDHKQSLSLWEQSLNVDPRRIGAMWAAASALRAQGLYSQSADLLQCLDEIFDQSSETFGDTRDVIDLTAKFLDGRRTHLRDAGRAISKRAYMLQRARDLASSPQRRLEALAELEGLRSELKAEDESAVRAALEIAWLRTLVGDHHEALRELEACNPTTSTERAMSDLCRANALMCLEKFDEAHATLARVRSGNLFKNGIASRNAWANAAVEELRMIVLNNCGVLEACVPETRRRLLRRVSATLHTAASSVKDVVSNRRRPHLGDIRTALEFNRTVVDNELGDGDAVNGWLVFQKLTDQDEIELDDIAWDASKIPQAAPHVYKSLAVDKIPDYEKFRMNEVCRFRKRAKAVDDKMLEAAEEIEKHWRDSRPPQ